MSWGTFIFVLLGLAAAYDQPVRGEMARHVSFPTGLPTYRLLNPKRALQRADLPEMLYAAAAIGAYAWGHFAAAAVQPQEIGVTAAVLVQILSTVHFVGRAFAPLREMGELAGFIREQTFREAAATLPIGTDVALGDLVHGTTPPAPQPSEAYADQGPAALSGAGEKGRPKTRDQGSTSGLLRLQQAERSADAFLDDAVRSLREAHAKTLCWRGCGWGEEAVNAARERRTAAKDLARLDDGVRDARASQAELYAKFHVCVLVKARDARNEHRRSLARFVYSRLEAAHGKGGHGVGEMQDGAPLPSVATLQRRIEALPAVDLAMLETAAAVVREREARAKRAAQIAFIKESRLLLFQSSARERGVAHRAALKRRLLERRGALSRAASQIRGARQDLMAKLPDARAVADQLNADLSQLQRVDAGAASKHRGRELEAPRAFIQRDVSAAITQSEVAEEALAKLVEGVAVHEIRQREDAAVAELLRVDAEGSGGPGAPPGGSQQLWHQWHQQQPDAAIAGPAADSGQLLAVSLPPEIAAAEPLPAELRADADLANAARDLAAFIETCRRVDAAVATQDNEVLAKLAARADAAKAELQVAAARLEQSMETLRSERRHVAAAVATALARKAAAERAEEEARRRAEEAARERKLLEEREAAERARRKAEEAERRRQLELRSLDENGRMLLEVVEPRLEDVRRAGRPYTDPSFVPEGVSLIPLGSRKAFGSWKRANEIVQVCNSTAAVSVFGDDGVPNPDDMVQGAVGNCWFCSALSVLALRPALVKDIFVTPGPLPLTGSGSDSSRTAAAPSAVTSLRTSEESAGLYCVRFFKNGTWTAVCVDDFFPTRRNGQWLMGHTRGSQLWVSLLEKAYASLHGSYGAIEAGFIEDALCDLTGGVRIQPPKLTSGSERAVLWQELEQLANSGRYLLGASSSLSPEGHGDTHTSPLGIVYGHAYAVLQVVCVRGGEETRLLQLRNPWGRTEWQGRWGDADMARPENARVRDRVHFSVEKDEGIFWIGFDDFIEHFRSLSICMLPTGWECASVAGEWFGETAGGCSNHDTVANNPQFLLTIRRPVDAVITLSQHDQRIGAHGGGDSWDHAAIGFTLLYGAQLRRVCSRADLFRYEVADTDRFVHARERSLKQHLSMRGDGDQTTYLVLPCTFDAGVQSKFTLRVFTPKGSSAASLVPVDTGQAGPSQLV